MDKPELNKKSLKELRGELFANRNGKYWQNDEKKQELKEDIEQSAEQNNVALDEEDMGM